MKFSRVRQGWIGVLALASVLPAWAGADVAPAPRTGPAFVSRADTPPRKVVIASALAGFAGTLAERLRLAARLLDDAAREASAKFAGQGLDLMVLPEFALLRETGVTAAEKSVSLDDPALATLAAKAREHHTWVVAPMTLREGNRISNAAVLFNREGQVAGIFRKVHPIADENGVFEDGVTPGASHPVFDCDFGRLGILICWDMGYEESWDALAAGGAELVALPSASPQTLQPMAQALRHHYHVVTSAPRNNVSLFDPIGRTVAQVTTAPGVLVHRIDLSYAILHWSETLQEGRALTDRFGDKVGYAYSTREDTGVFWSNDPRMSIGAMIRELGLREMPDYLRQMEEAARRFRATGQDAR